MKYYLLISKTTLLLYSSIILLKETATVNIHEGPRDWCYDYPECGPSSEKWGELCLNGIRQSPLNLIGCKGQKPIPAHVSLKLEHLKADHFFMRNSGHSVNLDFRDFGDGSYIFPAYDVKSNHNRDIENFLTRQSDLPKTCNSTDFELIGYKFSKAHFHWGETDDEGSEHLIDGIGYSMELHLVHHNDRYKNIKEAVASGDPNALAVVGIFLEASPDSEPNPALAPIVKHTIQVREPTTNRCWMKVEKEIDLSVIVPGPKARLYFYKGSLTSPGCNEQVNWYVFEKPVPIAHSDVEAFRKIRDWNGNLFTDNHRPVQPANGRNIYLLQLD